MGSELKPYPRRVRLRILVAVAALLAFMALSQHVLTEGGFNVAQKMTNTEAAAAAAWELQKVRMLARGIRVTDDGDARLTFYLGFSDGAQWALEEAKEMVKGLAP